MDAQRTPFDSIEGSLEYVGMLREAIRKANDQVLKESAIATSVKAGRRLEALRIVTYKLDRLDEHMKASHTLLNELRTLKRLLVGERQSGQTTNEGSAVVSAKPRNESLADPCGLEISHRMPISLIVTAPRRRARPAKGRCE